MNTRSDADLARVARPIPALLSDERLERAVLVTLVVGGYMAIGAAFELSADAYLLLGIPITIAFQVLVVRRPLRAMWLRDALPLTLGPRSMLVAAVVAVAPAAIAVRGAQAADPVVIVYGLAAMVGAVGVVYAGRAMDRATVRSTMRATVINSTILVGIMVGFRLVTGGFSGDAVDAVAAAVISVLTYLPAVFVVEEVLFRGLLDPYLHGATTRRDRATAIYGSALWGLWHLPVMSVDLGLLTIPYLVIVHTVMGVVLVAAWRRTGNLAAPGIAHAVSDAFRNAVAVL